MKFKGFQAFGFFLSFALILVTVGGCFKDSDSGSDNEDIQNIRIITTGFLQGRMAPFERRYSRNRIRKFGGPSNIAATIDTLIGEAREKGYEPILVDLGDNLSGSAEALLTKGAVMARFLSELPLSATLLGNLEFAHGQNPLTKYFQEMKIPFVASNILKEDGSSLPFTNEYIEQKVGNTKILIAGLTPPNLKYICLPANTKGIQVMNWFDDALKAMNKEKAKRNAEILLVLSQESLGKKDEKLKKALNNNKIDIFVGLDFSRKGIVRESKNGYSITFPGHNRGQRIGITDFSYSKKRGIFSISTKFKTIESDRIQGKPSIDKWMTLEIDKYRKELDKEIAVCSADLDRQFFNEGDTGNLVADAIKEMTGASIVCINSGGVASDLPKGPVKLRALYTMIPYQNKVVSFNIRGIDFLKFLRATLGKGSPLQIAGLKIKLRAIEGKRGFEIINITVGGKPVDENTVYKFATNDFLKGRSPQLVENGEIEEKGLVRDCVSAYLKQHTPYLPPSKSRIIIDN